MKAQRLEEVGGVVSDSEQPTHFLQSATSARKARSGLIASDISMTCFSDIEKCVVRAHTRTSDGMMDWV